MDYSIKNTATNQAVGRGERGRFIRGNKPKVGFHTNPERRCNGRWKKEDSISYQYNMFLGLTVKKFKDWFQFYPESKRTVAQELAYQAVYAARTDLKYLEEITDRTEGKAPQTIVNEEEFIAVFDSKQIERIAERITGRNNHKK